MTKRTITVGTASAVPGETGTGYLRVGAMSMGVDLAMPVAIVNGRDPGPILWLNGAVHGDEVNAFMVLRQVLGKLDPATLKGAAIFTPLSNPASVHSRSKINNLDWLDMDQQFPGRADGTYSQRTAHILFQNVREYASHLISFHTVGTGFDALPYTVYKFASGMSSDARNKTEAMALAFGAELNCRVDLSTASGEIAGGVDGALDAACASQGITAFMAEIGSGGEFQKGPVARGVDGVFSVMAHLGMTDTLYPSSTCNDRMIVTKRAFIYANKAGMLIDCASSGNLVRRGETLCNIVDFFSDKGTMRVDHDVIVIMSRRDPVIHEGDRVAFLALEWVKNQ